MACAKKLLLVSRSQISLGHDLVRKIIGIIGHLERILKSAGYLNTFNAPFGGDELNQRHDLIELFSRKNSDLLIMM